MSREQRMVVPPTATVQVIERGTGVKVQVEISLETHQRMRLELMRRERQGLPATVERLLLDVIEREKNDWPSLPEVS